MIEFKPVAGNFYWGFFWTKRGPFGKIVDLFYKSVDLFYKIEWLFKQNSGPFLTKLWTFIKRGGSSASREPPWLRAWN